VFPNIFKDSQAIDFPPSEPASPIWNCFDSSSVGIISLCLFSSFSDYEPSLYEFCSVVNFKPGFILLYSFCFSFEVTLAILDETEISNGITCLVFGIILKLVSSPYSNSWSTQLSSSLGLWMFYVIFRETCFTIKVSEAASEIILDPASGLAFIWLPLLLSLNVPIWPCSVWELKNYRSALLEVGVKFCNESLGTIGGRLPWADSFID